MVDASRPPEPQVHLMSAFEVCMILAAHLKIYSPGAFQLTVGTDIVTLRFTPKEPK